MEVKEKDQVDVVLVTLLDIVDDLPDARGIQFETSSFRSMNSAFKKALEQFKLNRYHVVQDDKNTWITWSQGEGIKQVEVKLKVKGEVHE